MADSHAHEASQAAQVHVLQDNALRDILTYLLGEIEATKSQVRDVARLTEIVSQPEAPAPPGLVSHHRHAKHRERPDWLKVYPGGMAAMLAPAALMFHSPLLLGLPGMLRAAHRAWRSHWSLMTASAILLGAAGTAISPAPGDMPDEQVGHRPPAVYVHHHRYRFDCDRDFDAPMPGTRPFM